MQCNTSVSAQDVFDNLVANAGYVLDTSFIFMDTFAVCDIARNIRFLGGAVHLNPHLVHARGHVILPNEHEDSPRKEHIARRMMSIAR